MVENGTHVFAQTNLNENMGFNAGAENAAPDLYLDPKVLK